MPNRLSVLSIRHTLLLIAALLCASLVFLPSCSEKEETATPPPVKKQEITIAAVGDVMMPASIQAFVAKNKNTYDLLFEKIAPDLSAADITIANLETPVDHKAPVSGYPKFNARPGLLAALKRAGVDIVSLANNHVMDAGTVGLKRTLENIEATGLAYTGAGKTKTDAAAPRSLFVKGITATFLAYTYSTNERLPRKKKDAPGVNILRANSAADLGRAAEQVKEARKQADLVVVSLHWGDEYTTKPTAWQKQAASVLVEAGADIILGHHPHVLEPLVTSTAQDGRAVLVAYSLGNFISSQNYGVSYKNRNNKRALRGDGIILSITARKDPGRTSITKVEFSPIWTLRETIGKARVSRPVSLSREIARLEAMSTKNRKDEQEIALLKHRQDIIIRFLTQPPQ